MSKRRYIVAVMLLLCVSFAGMRGEANILSSLADMIIPGKAPSCDFFPLERDTVWRYEEARIQDGVSQVRKDNPITLAVQTVYDYSASGRTRDIYMLSLKNKHDYAIFTWDVYCRDGDIYLFTGDTPLFDFHAEPGTVMPVPPADSRFRSHSSPDLSTITYLGTETVEVPAGTFKDCRKYRLDVVTSRIEHGETEPTLRQMSQTCWFARDVGIVKIGIDRAIDSGDSIYRTYSLTSRGTDKDTVKGAHR